MKWRSREAYSVWSERRTNGAPDERHCGHYDAMAIHPYRLPQSPEEGRYDKKYTNSREVALEKVLG